MTATTSLDSFNCRRKFTVGKKTYEYFSLKAAEKNGLKNVSKLPFSLRVLLENLLRHEDGRTVTKDDIIATAKWAQDRGKAGVEIGFRPARVLMQDFTGVPAVVDLAAMRDGMNNLGGDPRILKCHHVKSPLCRGTWNPRSSIRAEWRVRERG